MKYFLPSYRRELEAREHIAPYLQQRLDAPTTYTKPRNDLLQALIDESPPHQRDIANLVSALFAVHAAVHSATTFFIASAISMLSSDPDQYMPILRAELHEHLGNGKISKQLLDKLVKLDSFLRESARLNNSTLLIGETVAMQDFTFSDGTFIPKGTTLGVPMQALHTDTNAYSNPESFDPWRYSNVREKAQNIDGQWAGPGMQATDVNGISYLHFGLKQHSW